MEPGKVRNREEGMKKGKKYKRFDGVRKGRRKDKTEMKKAVKEGRKDPETEASFSPSSFTTLGVLASQV